ncbi:DUF6262 family protein [Plantactinospora alkalitolerans]|uniref:DUF6262 family protein n=1 Tax=Plantactinospora alkalitolerans TaxID=2789879 RepID=UPI002102703F|nr:DUF6262 family protein [Plantactinospora alkalitolerans]
MRANNSQHIVEAARRRSQYTRSKAIPALRELDTAGEPVTFEAVAKRAGVSRSWLYGQPDLRTEVGCLRTAHRRAPASQLPVWPTHIRRLTAAAPRSSQHARSATDRREPSPAEPTRPRTRRTTSRPRMTKNDFCGPIRPPRPSSAGPAEVARLCLPGLIRVHGVKWSILEVAKGAGGGGSSASLMAW